MSLLRFPVCVCMCESVCESIGLQIHKLDLVHQWQNRVKIYEARTEIWRKITHCCLVELFQVFIYVSIGRSLGTTVKKSRNGSFSYLKDTWICGQMHNLFCLRFVFNIPSVSVNTIHTDLSGMNVCSYPYCIFTVHVSVRLFSRGLPLGSSELSSSPVSH